MNFVFGDPTNLGAAFRADIPQGKADKAALLDALAAELRLPDYFGSNWDAFEECVRDLSWLPPGDVLLYHEDVPLHADAEGLLVYLDILERAIDKWSVSGRRRLVVAFPKQEETRLRELLGG